jgi:hypothetical protein
MAASPWTVQSRAQISSIGNVESRRSSSATKSCNTGSQTSEYNYTAAIKSAQEARSGTKKKTKVHSPL